MRYPLFLLILFASLQSVFADAPVIDRPIFGGPGVGLGATVTAASMDSIYAKILQYNFQYLALTELEAIETRVEDRVFWEFHAGVGADNARQFNKLGFLGVKMNLWNGKMADAPRLASRIRKLQGYLRLAGDRGFDQKGLLLHTDSLARIVNAYNRPFSVPRVGVAFWVPIYGEYRSSATVSRDLTDTTGVDSLITTERSSSKFLYEDFARSAVALTADVGDRLTFSVGVNLRRELFLGVSVDVSTPTSDFVNSFRSELKPLRTPLTGSLE